MGSRRKRVAGRVKLEIEAGRATPAPPVGRDLGPYGIDIGEFVRRYNDATRDQMGTVIPAVVTIYEDRPFGFITKTPPTAVLLREAAGIDKGAAMPNREAAGTVTPEQIRSIAERKMPDLNASSRSEERRV